MMWAAEASPAASIGVAGVGVVAAVVAGWFGVRQRRVERRSEDQIAEAQMVSSLWKTMQAQVEAQALRISALEAENAVCREQCRDLERRLAILGG